MFVVPGWRQCHGSETALVGRITLAVGVSGLMLESGNVARPVVLIVDDDSGVRESFRLILEGHYEVVACPTASPPSTS